MRKAQSREALQQKRAIPAVHARVRQLSTVRGQQCAFHQRSAAEELWRELAENPGPFGH